jgi:hypothetical protein
MEEKFGPRLEIVPDLLKIKRSPRESGKNQNSNQGNDDD